MSILSFCKNIDFSEFIDFEIIKTIFNEISTMNNASSAFQVIISDDASIINSFRAKFTKEALLLIPMVALLKQDSSYSAMYNCISSGAAALVIKI